MANENQIIIGAGQGTARPAPKKYKTIMMDPPWPISWFKADSIRTRNLQYQTMAISEMAALPITEIADEHCLLLMWVTNQFLQEGLGLTRLWKFQFDKLFTWCKNNGMGGFIRSGTEHVIIATRGCPVKFDRHAPMVLNWMNTALPQEHSRKPDEIIDLFTRLSPEPRLEMFARQRRQGWTAWGNEIEESPVLGEESPAQNIMEICHTAPNRPSTPDLQVSMVESLL